jgi:7-cyano-7-deazaguanine synthase in queuosine biosynthesis
MKNNNNDVKNKEYELVLFSGGPDSTILLNYLLKQNKNILVLHVQNGWCYEYQKTLTIQREVVVNILKYFTDKKYDFKFINTGLFIDLPQAASTFGLDDQWCAFMGAIICRSLNIKKMWSGYFTYTDNNRKEFYGHGTYWIHDGSLREYINYGTRNDPNFKDLEYLTPKLVFNGTGIDSFNTKKEAFDSLDDELKKLVRSCTSGEVNFCGQCYKCKTYIHHKVKNEKGDIL